MHRARMAASTRRPREPAQPVKMRYGYNLVTDCRKANQGNKSHTDVEARRRSSATSTPTRASRRPRPSPSRTTSKQTSCPRASRPPPTPERPRWGGPGTTYTARTPAACRTRATTRTQAGPARTGRTAACTRYTWPRTPQASRPFPTHQHMSRWLHCANDSPYRLLTCPIKVANMSANTTSGEKRQLAPQRERRESPARLEHEAGGAGDDLDHDMHHGRVRNVSIVGAPAAHLSMRSMRVWNWLTTSTRSCAAAARAVVTER